MGLTTAAFAALLAVVVHLWTQEETQEEIVISKTPHTRDVPGGTTRSASSMNCESEGSIEVQFICAGAHGAMITSQDDCTVGTTAVSLDLEQDGPYLGWSMRSPRRRYRARQFLWRLPSPRSWSQSASFCLFRKGKAGEPHARASYTDQKRSAFQKGLFGLQSVGCSEAAGCSTLGETPAGPGVRRERRAWRCWTAESSAAGCGKRRRASFGPGERAAYGKRRRASAGP